MQRSRGIRHELGVGVVNVSEIPRICKTGKKYEMYHTVRADTEKDTERWYGIMREDSSMMGLRWRPTQHWCRSRLSADSHLGARS